jgi:hypothetical protein
MINFNHLHHPLPVKVAKNGVLYAGNHQLSRKTNGIDSLLRLSWLKTCEFINVLIVAALLVELG